MASKHTWRYDAIQDLAILGRLSWIVRREERKAAARGILCPRGCGELVFYSAADVVYLHGNGEYFCGS